MEAKEPCIRELEVYGRDGKRNLAAAKEGGKATASSCLAGYAIHRIEHLDDGRYGNRFSWIAAGTVGEWAQIELAKPAQVAKVVFFPGPRAAICGPRADSLCRPAFRGRRAMEDGQDGRGEGRRHGGAGPFSYEQVVQPVWDAVCAGCHDADDKQKIDLNCPLWPDYRFRHDRPKVCQTPAENTAADGWRNRPGGI